MKVPYRWLISYCDPGLSVEEVGDALALHSIELERISRLGVPSTEGFVVGTVVSASKHPDADRLSVCDVDTGDGTRTIVCGAPNVAAGQTVAVALPGAVLPGGTELKQAKLRGVVSDGMILSEPEVELGDDADQIMELSDEGLAPGTPLEEVLPISEAVLELEPTSNRVDCFGVYGVARELHAVTGAELAPAPWDNDAEATGKGAAEDLASVTVEVPELCPRFTARIFDGVTIGPSPTWLKARLLGAGMRPINNVVDITNYVMLLTAQPLHAFDLERVPGGELMPTRSSSAIATARRASPESWGARRARSPTRRRESCSKSRTGTASTSSARRASSGCAPTPPAASKSSCIRSSPCGRSALRRS
jgi:phenylalanyl-tRNA synthetase beta chain